MFRLLHLTVDPKIGGFIGQTLKELVNLPAGNLMPFLFVHPGSSEFVVANIFFLPAGFPKQTFYLSLGETNIGASAGGKQVFYGFEIHKILRGFINNC